MAAALLLTGTGEASAHAFPRRCDLPLPLGHWLIGAGGAVALQCVCIVIFVLLIAAGLLGDQGDWNRAILPVAVPSAWVAWPSEVVWMGTENSAASKMQSGILPKLAIIVIL